MEITLSTILSIIGGLGSLIGVWVSLHNKITRQEKDIEHLKASLSQTNSNHDRLSEKIERMEASLSQILAALNRLEGRLEK